MNSLVSVLFLLERKSALPVKDTQKATKEPLDKSPQVHDLTTISKTKKPAKSLSSRFAEYVSVPAKKWKEEKGEVITISVPVNESSKSRKVPAKEKPVIPKGSSLPYVSFYSLVGSKFPIWALHVKFYSTLCLGF